MRLRVTSLRSLPSPTTTRPLSEPSGSVTACCRPEFIPKAVIASVKYPETTPSVSYPACADPTLTDTLKSAFYASNTLAVKPTLERLACANMQTGCLDICEINGNELIRVNEVHLTPAKVKFNRHRPKGRGLVHPVNYSKYHIFGFCDLAVSDDYIYALYSGRTLKQHNLDVDKGKTILVFDWNGSHVRTYRLENACSSISYSAEENTIYALSQENNHSEIITLHL